MMMILMLLLRMLQPRPWSEEESRMKVFQQHELQHTDDHQVDTDCNLMKNVILCLEQERVVLL